jgi:hypothetical protein
MALLENKNKRRIFLNKRSLVFWLVKNVDKARFKKFDTLLQSDIEDGIKCSFKRESDLYQ